MCVSLKSHFLNTDWCMFYNAWCFLYSAVPMDLDVKMKAVMLAACFLIVSSSSVLCTCEFILCAVHCAEL